MERVQWLNHKGKKVLYLNYTKLITSRPEDLQQLRDIVKKGREVIEACKDKFRCISDVSDSIATKDAMIILKDFAKYTNSTGKIEKECIIGITGVQKMLVTAVNTFAKSKIEIVATLDKAKDWVVS